MYKCAVRIIAAMIALPIISHAWAGPAEDKALWDAARKHNVEAVREALQKGADPNGPSNTPMRFTPLGAIAIGCFDGGADKYAAVKVTKLLFAAGAKLGPYDKEILFFPIANGYVEEVKLLIDNGASPTDKLEGYTPTELARKYGQQEVYELLVARGGIPLDSKSSAQLALVKAAAYRDIKGMKTALKHGAAINRPDDTGELPLSAAVSIQTYKRSEAMAIWWLLDHGADPNREGKSGLPLNEFAIASNYTIDRPDSKPLAVQTLARLLQAGAKISGIDKYGRTPLHVTAKYDNVWMAEILIKEGAKVMPRDNASKTPLDYAKSAAMIRLLKQNGATER